jgi:hypothetical protein
LSPPPPRPYRRRPPPPPPHSLPSLPRRTYHRRMMDPNLQESEEAEVWKIGRKLRSQIGKDIVVY